MCGLIRGGFCDPGDLEVQPFIAFDNVHFLENESLVERRTMPLSQVIEHVFEGRPVTLGKHEAPKAVVAAAPPPAKRRFAHANGISISTTAFSVMSTASVMPEEPAAQVVANRIYLRGALFDKLRDDIQVPAFMEGGNAKLSDTLRYRCCCTPHAALHKPHSLC